VNSPYWFEVAVVFGLTAVGNILLGQWEAGTPKWRRVLKPFMISGLGILLSATLGREWFLGFLGLLLAAVAVVHGWWLPRQGINGWTAEPWEKYCALRGWHPPPAKPGRRHSPARD